MEEKTQEQAVETAKTYTQEEVDALLQAEGDRRVTQALKKKEKEMSEAAKLSAMDESEKAKYQLEQREKDLQERERVLALNENKLAAIQILADKGMPVKLADFVVAPDADTTKANITAITKIINDAVAEKVKSAVGYNPLGSGNGKGALTKEEVGKMSLKEQQELYRSNPDLYKQLFVKN